ncbi:SGNH/GDSL hydrolase family protein [Salegentibacter sediminis]|uniref:SGNH/GDSL hydrolase family protein n=1 Tax=Salegentibacter sediminis TaxID=1930251 RepID=UPI0009C0ABBC|nr:SGNH/GDSL hydrolase family protein [Salegentibacter sediminis]
MKNFYAFMILLLSLATLNAQNKDRMEQDWPNLQKYHKENQKLKDAGKKPLAVFMGNSITEGWVNTHPEFFSKNNFIGRGIGGQTTPQMLIRFTPDVIDLKPEVVVILAGTNDIAGNTGASSVKMITDNIKAMAQLARANGIKVVLSSILPVYDYPWQPGINPVEKIAAVNKWMENYALENEHTYLDYFPALANEKKGMKSEYAEDGVHPTKKGYAVMEPLVHEAVKKAQQSK